MLELNGKVDLIIEDKFKKCFTPFVDKVKISFDEVQEKLKDMEINLRM